MELAPPVDPANRLSSSPFRLWTRQQAVALLGRGRVDRLVAGGSWRSPWPGVLCAADEPLDLARRSAAALLASGGIGHRLSPDGTRTIAAGALCGRSAARWWRFPLLDDADPATGADELRIDDVHTWTRQRDLVVPVPGASPRELRRHRLTLAADDLRVSQGIWVLSPPRALFDCARLLTLEALVCALDDALRRQVCTTAELEAMAAAHLGDEGAPRFREALRLADGRSESVGETLTRLLLLPDLPRLRPQLEVRDERGRLVARLDLGDDEALFAVEFDGKAGHSGTEMVAKDRRRDRRTGALGWWTERVTWFDVRRRRRETRRRVLEEHARWSAVTRLRRRAA